MCLVTDLSREAVAYPGLREDILGLPRTGLDLLAQLVDEDAQVFGLVAVVRAPHGLQKFAMGHGTAGVRHQVAQGLELLGREADRSEEHTSELQSLRHIVCRLL